MSSCFFGFFLKRLKHCVRNCTILIGFNCVTFRKVFSLMLMWDVCSMNTERRAFTVATSLASELMHFYFLRY